MVKAIAVGLALFTFGAFANIEHEPLMATVPSDAQVQKSRSCFQELQNLGCGHPRDDRDQFISCMRNTYNSLSTDCQSMMKRLYGK